MVKHAPFSLKFIAYFKVFVENEKCDFVGVYSVYSYFYIFFYLDISIFSPLYSLASIPLRVYVAIMTGKK